MDLTLEEVHARHYGELVGFARKKLREVNVPQSFIDPEDVVGNAFVKAYRDPARIQQPRAYLFQIVRREVLEHARRARNHERVAEAAQADLRLEADDVSDVISAQCDVHRALASLPAQQRAAVWATKGLDWSQAEYAQAAQKSPGTVGVHVSRAVKVLKTTLVLSTLGAVILLCGAGGVTLRRYTAASRAGRPRPDLVPDLPHSVTILLWGLAAAYVCLLLALGCLRVFPLLGRLISFIRQWSRRTRGGVGFASPPDEPSGAASAASSDKTEYCPNCGKTTVHRQLTKEEERLFHATSGDPNDSSIRICTSEGCRRTKYVLSWQDIEASLILPELPGPSET
ncbi:RNA polymerase sigma factor [Streptomyces sp. NPDC058695]|uniref:RNA polymerase sigma factor n=1 Tax=Streptomyces sp. NPDC058695 TaxID=3346604 RepID=UPI0036673614